MSEAPINMHRLAGAGVLGEYLDALERQGLQIACNSCAALPYDDVRRTLAGAYRDFAREAARRGLQSCIFLSSTLSAGDVVPISEAQFGITNEPERYGENGFYASFASEQWLDYLKDLTGLFVRDYGYEWVVFGEPLFQVDIPGTEDRFAAAFERAYPNVEYPLVRAETSEYLKVQKLKTELVVQFCGRLISNAKDAGANQVGTVARPNTPTTENTPPSTLNTACDEGCIASLPGLDFVVVNNPARDVLSGVMKTEGEMSASPLLCYSEILSHMKGKPVVLMSNSSVSEDIAGIPPGLASRFSRTAILSSAAAAPTGFLTCEIEENSEKGSREAISTANSVLQRVSAQLSNVAFVYSSAGTWHAEPYTCETVWQFYWAIAEQLLFKDKRTLLTFTADALKRLLDMNPQVQVLILEEHFPLTAEQVSTVLRWWTEQPSRAIVVIGGGQGFSASPERPGLCPTAEAFPGLFEKIGLRQEVPPVVELGDREQVVLNRCINSSSLPVRGEKVEAERMAAVRRVFGSRASVILSDQQGRTVATQWFSGSTVAVFCGLGSSPATSAVISKLVQYALVRIGCDDMPVVQADEGVLWNATRDGYVVVANCTDHPARATVSKRPSVYWDVLEERLISEPDVKMKLAPQSLRVVRCTPKRSKMLDVTGAIRITSIMAGSGKADIALYVGVNTAFLCRGVPREAMVDGVPTLVNAEPQQDCTKVTLPEMTPGAHLVTFHW